MEKTEMLEAIATYYGISKNVDFAKFFGITEAAAFQQRTIGAALGHSTSKSVTSIYIRVDMRKKVDAANRRVIDAVFQTSL